MTRRLTRRLDELADPCRDCDRVTGRRRPPRPDDRAARVLLWVVALLSACVAAAALAGVASRR